MNQCHGIKRKRELPNEDGDISSPREKKREIEIGQPDSKIFSCPIKRLSRDEWGHILSFLELGHNKNIDKNLPLLLTCHHVSELIDWKLILQNICFGKEFTGLRHGLIPDTRLDHILKTLHAKEGIGSKVFEVILTNESVVPRLMTRVIAAACYTKEFQWDWELALRTCRLPEGLGEQIEFMSATKLLCKTQDEKVVVHAILKNETCDQSKRNELLELAVDENFSYLVPIIFSESDEGYFNEREPMDLLSRALIKDRGEIAKFLQNDPRINQRIEMCFDCQQNPSCVNCDNFHYDTCLGSPGNVPKRYCKPCEQNHICTKCRRHTCQECREGEVTEIKYARCMTCSQIFCRRFPTNNLSDTCYLECANFEICGKIQCLGCSYASERGGNDGQPTKVCLINALQNATLPHLFCQDCSPLNVNYIVGDTERNDSEKGCPACQNTNLRKCLTCGVVELNTVENSSVWFKCPNNSVHMFCSSCSPIRSGEGKTQTCPSC